VLREVRLIDGIANSETSILLSTVWQGPSNSLYFLATNPAPVTYSKVTNMGWPAAIYERRKKGPQQCEPFL
jgi:hypothetical protein